MSNKHCGIYAPNPDLLLKRVMISGVSIAEQVVIDSDPPYAPWAVVPTLHDLHTPTMNELQPFMVTDETPFGGYIEVIGPTRALLEALRNREGILPKASVNQPGQLTTTVNEKTSWLQGLHIDNHENKPAPDRLKSKRRIGCCMQGEEKLGARALLIASIDALDLATLYGAELGPPEQYIPSTRDFRRYVAESMDDERLPAVQCLWLLLGLGQAYIAPTEVIGHDATTHLAKLVSKVEFRLGDWQPAEFGSII